MRSRRQIDGKRLTKGLRSLRDALSTTSSPLASGYTLPSAPGLPSGFTAPSINVYAVADAVDQAVETQRDAALATLSEFQAIVPTLPDTLDSIRDKVPSIQAANLQEGLHALESLTGDLRNIPGGLTDATQDLAAQLSEGLAQPLEELQDEFGQIRDKIRTEGNALFEGQSGLQDLTSGLQGMVDQLSGIPNGIDRDALQSALAGLSAQPIMVARENSNTERFTATLSSYLYRPIL